MIGSLLERQPVYHYRRLRTALLYVQFTLHSDFEASRLPDIALVAGLSERPCIDVKQKRARLLMTPHVFLGHEETLAWAKSPGPLQKAEADIRSVACSASASRLRAPV